VNSEANWKENWIAWGGKKVPEGREPQGKRNSSRPVTTNIVKKEKRGVVFAAVKHDGD